MARISGKPFESDVLHGAGGDGMTDITPVAWSEGRVRLIDQTRLPGELTYLECSSPAEVADAIRTLAVRGAPAIGVAGAYALALCAHCSTAEDPAALLAELAVCATMLRATRPTGRNLFWAIDRMLGVASGRRGSAAELRTALLAEAEAILRDDQQRCRKIGAFGAALVPDGATILTHCNAGALATGGYGTALGVIRAAVAEGKRVSVFVDETRPLLQGARLTAWELLQEGIPTTLIADNMVATVMRQRKVDLVVVGADRIARNGDVANKVGTYTVALVAKEFGVPFYVAAPVSTFDLSLASGDDIPIEERGAEEVTTFAGVRVAPEGVAVYNPAFDVTPHELIAAIICEKGVLRPPFARTLGEAATEVS
jgi:methylthioribose-1-phosphate isomerase